MSKQKLILIGGGGHCKACIDVIEQASKYEILGVLDEITNVGKYVLGYEIIGTDDDLKKIVKPDVQFLITIGQIKSATIRVKIFKLLKQHSASLATVISPNAYVSRYAKINSGTIVMHGAVINADASIGTNNILNTGCKVEHDSVIGDHCHISTQAVINGGCVIGDEVFVGSNATIANHLSITESVVIGAGAVVTKNIDKPGIYVGSPLLKIS